MAKKYWYGRFSAARCIGRGRTTHGVMLLRLGNYQGHGMSYRRLLGLLKVLLEKVELMEVPEEVGEGVCA